MNAPTLRGLCLAACAVGCSATPRQVTTPLQTQTTETTPPVPTGPLPIPSVEQRAADSPIVTIRVVFTAGSADDPQGHEGAAWLAARWMKDGGTQSLSYEELQKALFPMAASISITGDRDMIAFTGQVHRDWIDKFYPIFRDVILKPRLADDDFRRVKSQMTSELLDDLRNGDDEELGKEMLQSLIYQSHPYGHPALGTETGLASLTPEIVRTVQTGLFTRSRVLFGLAGGYPEALAAQMRADLETLPATGSPLATLPRPTRPDGLHVVVIDKPSARATAISIGFPLGITRKDSEFTDVQFVTHYLGLHRQSSGVLYQTIREARGLNYGDYAYSEYFEQQDGTRFPAANIQRRQQFMSLWLRPLPPDKAHFALRAAVRALATVLDQGISAADLDRSQKFLGGYVSLYTQNQSSRLGYALDDLWNQVPGTTAYADRLRTAWNAIDPATLRARAQMHLTARNMWVAIVAPNATALAQAIGTNAPSPITYPTEKPEAVVKEDLEIAQYPLPVLPASVEVVPLASTFH